MAHTPGPWKWLYVQDVSGDLLPNSPELIYRVSPVMRVSDYAILNEDDAILIAAAPEMLEALKDIIIQLSNSGMSANLQVGWAKSIAFAAIAKAEAVQ